MLVLEDFPSPSLKNALDGIDPGSEQELEDLQWEYSRLFIGPYRLPCPPLESVYTSPGRLMMQDAYFEVQEYYREAGMIFAGDDIMPDHIGAELNFLAVLFQKMNDETEPKIHYADIARRFLCEHLVKWVPQFASDMEEAADSEFYRSLARATREFVLLAVDVVDAFQLAAHGAEQQN